MEYSACYYALGFLCCIFTTSFVIVCKVLNGYWTRRGVYTLHPKLFFGNTAEVILQRKSFGEHIKDFYNTIKQKGYRYGGYYFLMRPTFVAVDLDLIKTIFIKDFEHFTDHPSYVNEEKDPLSAHLFSQKGEKWKKLRAKITPAFTSGNLKMMFETLLKCCQELEIMMKKKVESKEVIDMKDVISKLSLDVIGSCAFGLDCNSLKSFNNDLQKYGSRFFHDQSIKGSIIHLISIVCPDFFHYINVNIHDKEMTKFFTTLVEDVVQYREENGIVRKDIMHLLLQLKNNGEIRENDAEGATNVVAGDMNTLETLTLRELMAQCFVFFVAGFETTSFATTCCMYELSVNESFQDKVREEMNRVLHETDGKITYEILTKMKFLEKCIYETLRKYPPVAVQTRVCTKQYKVPNSDVILNKGMPVIIPTLGIHMDPDYYPNPELFDPERFSVENKSSLPPCAWIPFSGGPRTCVAFRFGLLQIKVGLVTLLRRYKFSLHPSTKIPMKFDPKSFLLTSASPILLCAEKI
ncbi:hypothetical protein RI129_006035 [Pyrocoelia pectoralis]|uniref:Cytochrome P450 n=1 Tax=Pyrocoelia pectoralis TaxID=417401 RepID=A0AAN7ZFV9_9COLE